MLPHDRLGIVGVVVLVVGCVSTDRPEPPGIAVSWDFPSSVPKATVSLWPPIDGRAKRGRHQLRVEPEDGALSAVAAGKDPYFTWQLSEAVKAPAVRLELDSDAGGRFQVFWTSLECPVYAEQCSRSEDVPPGRQILNVLVGGTDSIRDIRVDLPERAGASVRLLSATIPESTEIDTAWEVGAESVEIATSPTGLVVTARADDPWISVSTPGLRASRATAIEVTLRAPSGPPQMYWTGPCAHFAEECSVRLAPVDAAALTHRASLEKHPKWSDDIRTLRFDPGPSAGEYRLERIAFVHD